MAKKRKAAGSATKSAKIKTATPEILPREGADAPKRQRTALSDPNEDFIEFEELEGGENEQSPDDFGDALPAAIQDARPGIHEPEMGAVSPTDPLRQYLEEVRRYPLLEPEEEFELAMRLRNEGDVNAAKRLITANLRLVVKIAFEYSSLYTNLMDLIQEGNVGLMKAVSKFDPTKGARLGYYSSWWIRSYILKYILDNFRLVKIGTTQAQKKLFYHLLREKERLEAQGILAAPKLLAERLDVREKDVVEMQQRLSSRGAEVSLDAPLDGESRGGSGASHLDMVPEEAEQADEVLARQQLLKLLQGKIPEFRENLDEKERKILTERLLAEEPKTLQEIADGYGLTRERARQIETKVIKKLRDFLQSELAPKATRK